MLLRRLLPPSRTKRCVNAFDSILRCLFDERGKVLEVQQRDDINNDRIFNIFRMVSERIRLFSLTNILTFFG